MKQRAALARVLAFDPKVLLMDEPFGALDAQTRELMQEELTRLWERTGKTIVFVTHDIEEAVYLGDRVVVLSARPGRIREEVKIDLPRPRALEIKKSIQCHEYRNYIWDLIRSESRAALKRLLVAAIGAMQAMMFAVVLYFGGIDPQDSSTRSLFHWHGSDSICRIACQRCSRPLALFAPSTRTRPLPGSPGRSRSRAAIYGERVDGAGGAAVYFDSVSMFVLFLLTARYVEDACASSGRRA
jgi:hypothetical protein